MLGLNQAQVRSDIGFTFLSGLRSALRQDPDIIMVGEIRDRETLEMAMESAMTGHLVFSTIHTNSAVETITRMLNMGAQSYMLAGTINLVIAQRLGRKVCSHCATKISVKDDPKYLYAKKTFQNFDKELLKKEIYARGITQQQWTDFFMNGYISQGTGKDPTTGEICPVCKGVGYKGRVGLYEMMDYTDDIKMMLLDGKSAFEIGKYALSQGMIDLERDGLLKAIKGQLDLKEVYRFVKVQDM
jgi:type IV pilus assembly protein PilB